MTSAQTTITIKIYLDFTALLLLLYMFTFFLLLFLTFTALLLLFYLSITFLLLFSTFISLLLFSLTITSSLQWLLLLNSDSDNESESKSESDSWKLNIQDNKTTVWRSNCLWFKLLSLCFKCIFSERCQVQISMHKQWMQRHRSQRQK